METVNKHFKKFKNYGLICFLSCIFMVFGFSYYFKDYGIGLLIFSIFQTIVFIVSFIFLNFELTKYRKAKAILKNFNNNGK
ncbi:hypothetical protein [Mesomycoplasma lagogenitalium]|uniref:Uncharacterized protein n=1 Tax=Mesomycoplasma lagogenitalium TaxID=171286 RepID=A0ABY8LVF1_9BACT|nr:hypothetical protein [Mesomycoplasma lagogenitalium]WGI36508.1 hypothetical protein QEG99_03520 [Mesomycoplasma lagogenitalium]